MIRAGSRLVAAVVTLSAISALACACAAVWGFNDAEPLLQDGALEDAGLEDAHDAGLNDGWGGDVALEDGAVADGRPGDCTTQIPDEVAGVFVAQEGSDDGACGSASAPCKTIQYGLDRAQALAGKTTLYVANGVYVEALTLRAGIAMEGGWKALRQGSSWQWVRACAEPPGTVSIVQAPSDKSVAVMADNLNGHASITDMTVHTKLANETSPGETLIAIFARGATTSLTLTDVLIIAEDGAAGAAGGPGDAGVAGGPDCPPDSGANGATQGGTGNASDGGAFTPDGFRPGDGQQGPPGGGGYDGVTPQPPACIACVTCSWVATICTASSAPSSCGTPGKAGCGGSAGAGGHGGGGGGSSIALYAWDAQVTVTRGKLHAGSGGPGGAAGQGGPGGPGGQGANGGPGQTCGTKCVASLAACTPTTDAGPAGLGTQGGDGTAGGSGGGGAGGSSFAYVASDHASVLVTGAVLEHGAAGNGSAGAANGNAADKGP